MRNNDKINIFLSIVIPVFNEEENVPVIYQKLSDVLPPIVNEYEILFVNDGSYDNTHRVILDISKLDRRVKLINLTRNFGHQASLTAGMDHTKGNIVITMDCDLQDPPELIVEMIKKWKEGALVVFARRRNRRDSFFKKYTAKLFYWLMKKFTDVKITGDIGDFRLIDSTVLRKLNNMREKSRYLRGMVAWLGYDYSVIDYDRPERLHGETNFSLLKMLRLAMDGLLNFSLLPLRLGFVIGTICILSGLSFLVFITFDAIFNQVDYPLYKWLIIALFILVGFLFILLWIMAEYIGKIYDEAKGRPIYVVRDPDNV